MCFTSNLWAVDGNVNNRIFSARGWGCAAARNIRWDGRAEGIKMHRLDLPTMCRNECGNLIYKPLVTLGWNQILITNP